MSPRVALTSLVLLLILASSLSACIQDSGQLSGTSADKPTIKQSNDEEGVGDWEEWEDSESGDDWEDPTPTSPAPPTATPVPPTATPIPPAPPTATRTPVPVRTKRP